MSNTVQVPVKWLKKLMELGEDTKNAWDIPKLKGYIESAEALLEATPLNNTEDVE